MAEITYPSEQSSGLWILDKEALKKFDEIIDSFLAKFQEQKKQDIEAEYLRRRRDFLGDPIYSKWSEDKQQQRLKEIQEEIEKSYRFVNDQRELKLKLESGKTLAIQRFSDVENEREVQEDAPTEFSLSLRCGLIEVKAKISSGILSGLEASVTPATPGVTQECLLALRQWAEEYKIHKAFWVWHELKAAGILWLLTVVAILFLTFLASAAGTARTIPPAATSSPGRTKLRDEAKELVKKGIQTQQDERRAVELALALQSDYDPDPPPPSLPPPEFRMPMWYWFAFGLIVALAVLLSFPPRTSIAVGKKGTDQVAWMKWWTNHTFYTIPTLFVSIVIVPLLKDAVQKIF